ncbi:protein smoothened-like [Ptychodera flava]|uniref:protein smoothened-like n=1 Tax=Ptychodera flava TaxID=63121 RepID=UPI00396A48DA
MADPGKIFAVFTVISFCQVFASIADNCKRAATCEPLATDSCLGTRLSHSHTSTILANDSVTQDDVREKLALWKGLKNVPRCWEVIQPLLCAVYMPKCENGFVELPSMDICSVTRGPCKIVEIDRGWPSFLRCDESHFQEGCDNTYAQLTFNTTSGCEPPLVETTNQNSFYENVEGCGIQCKNPLFTDNEHDQVHLFIAIMASLCVVSTFFTLATFFADWKNSNKYPALILFYMNGCFFVGSIGWLAQFTEGARDDIVCRKDGTLRLAEPSKGENLSCVIIFIIVYYFLMAGVSWFVMLTYAWHLSFRNLGASKGDDALQGKISYFHIISWSLPLVLVIIILAVGEVDGDSVSGICFVGYKNHYFRGGFVLAPIAVVLSSGGFFLIRGLSTLCSLKKNSPELLNDRASNKIKETIVRIGVFAFLCFLFVFTTFACHVYDFSNQHLWELGFRDYILCEANVTIYKELDMEPVACSINPRPSIAIYLIHLSSLFGAGIVMSTWVWTSSTLQIWQRIWRKVTMQPINEPQRVKKSRMIAKAFARRVNRGDDTTDDEKISISFETVSHDDPLGMGLELNKSCTSTDSSSQWTNVPMRMLTRRGATVLPPSSSTSTSPTPEPCDSRQITPTDLPKANLINENRGRDRSSEKKIKNRTRRKKRAKSTLSFHRPTNLISNQNTFDSAEDLQADIILSGPIQGAGNMSAMNGCDNNTHDEMTDTTSIDKNNRSTVPKLPAISTQRRVNIVGSIDPLGVGLPGQSDA